MSGSADESSFLFWFFDAFKLWLRKGGQYTFPLLIFGLMSLAAENLPAYLTEGLFLGAAGFGVAGIAFSLPYHRIAREGRRIHGTVLSSERRRKPLTGGKSPTYQRKISYSYHVDGTRYTGETDWVVKKKFGKIEPGDEFELFIDPKNPEVSYSVILVPTTNPEDYEV